MSENSSSLLIAEFIQALQDEIQALEKIDNPYTLVRFQQQIAHSDKQYWYLFEANHTVSILKDTPCQIHFNGKDYAVHVIESEGRSITLSSYKKLPKMSGAVRLERGAIVLVKRLVQCLSENKEVPNYVGMRMFPTHEGIYSPAPIATFDVSVLPKNNTARQNQAVFSALTNDISYLWGLPGSGKTTVIGQIIQHLYLQDRSVLVVSHTNTAVDGALEKALKHIDVNDSMTESSCPILRIGTPAKKLPRCLLLEEQAKALNQELSARHDALSAQQMQLVNRQKFLHPYLSKCNWLSNTKFEEIKNLQAAIFSLADEKKQLEEKRLELLEKFSDASRNYAKLTDCTLLQHELEEEKKQLSEIITQIAVKQGALEETLNHIRIAQDEIKKHEKYERMQEDENKYFSEEHYRQTLKVIQEKIDTINAAIQNLQLQQKTAQAIIDGYNGMNKFQKLFVNKLRVENAERDFAEAVKLLPVEEENLKQQQQLCADNSASLREICYLHEQMRLVQPTKVKCIWEITLQDAQAKKQNLQIQIEEHTQSQAQKQNTVQIISEKYAESSQAFSQKASCEKAIVENHHKILHCDQQKAKVETQFRQLLEQEFQLYCDIFSIVEDIPFEQLFDWLDTRLLAVKADVVSANADNIPQEYDENCKKLADIYNQLTQVEFGLEDTKQQIVEKAPIIGTTLTTSYMNPSLRGRKFDTVILDEASFASIPALWCATLLAEKNVVIVGDFMQLPPIVNAHSAIAKKWLGKDVFWHSGMQAIAKNPACCPDNFIMLNDQFRMESSIASIANLYYGEYGGIRSHDELRANARARFYDWFPGPKTAESVHLLDTRNYEAWTSRDLSGSSRVNSFTASINVAMAFHFIEKILKKLDAKVAAPVQEPKVLIVAQYAHHIEYIKQLIELEYQNRGFSQNLNYIQAGTVHSFQGMEADIVIFDLVLDKPDTNAMLFRQETNDLEIKRMLNVAVTRARFKLFVVGNFEFCLDYAGYNAFADFLKYILRFTKDDFSRYLPNIENMHNLELATKKVIYCNQVSFTDYFLAEIRQMHTGMTIYSPFFTENRLKQLLPVFKEAISRGKTVKIVTKTIANRAANKRDFYRYWEQQLCNIGVTIHHKNDMHEKLIFVDRNIVWNGSLNVLSYTGRTSEFMMRSVGLDIAKKQQI